MTELMSENEILERYRLQENTLTHVVDLGLMPESTQRRGRVVYPHDAQAKLTLTAAQLYFTELSNSITRVLPFQRAFICMAISEGPELAYRTLDRRGLCDVYKWEELERRWEIFVKKLPQASQKFMLGKTDTVDPLSNRIMEVLGVLEAFETPDLLKMPDIYENLELVADLDGLLVAKAPHDVAAAAIQVLHHTELSVASVNNYVHYYCDHQLLTAQEFIEHANRFQATSLYHRTLVEALNAKDYSDFVIKAKLPIRLEHNSELALALSRCRNDINIKVCGKITAQKQTHALNTALKILDHLGSTDIDEERTPDGDDMLRLRHDAITNQQQLTMEDIPARDLDKFATGNRSDDSVAEGTGDSA